MAIDVYGHLNRAVTHLVPHISERSASLNKEASKCVSQIVKADSP
jgi:hypothetical protein